MRHPYQVLVCAGEHFDGVVLGRQQISEASPDRLVIIHHEDARFQLTHASLASFQLSQYYSSATTPVIMGNEKCTHAPPPWLFAAAISPP